jgi:multisubunit Na+/H+ antiporter MnhE subunit
MKVGRARTYALVFWVAWWAVLFAVWLLLVGSLQADELIVGAAAAALSASVALAVRSRGYILFSPRLAWARELPELCLGIIVDTGLLGSALWRRVVRRERVRGQILRVPFHYGGENGRDGARRALVNFAVSITPNSYVVDIDPDADSLLVHRLVTGPIDPVLLREEQRALTESMHRSRGEHT